MSLHNVGLQPGKHKPRCVILPCNTKVLMVNMYLPSVGRPVAREALHFFLKLCLFTGSKMQKRRFAPVQGMLSAYQHDGSIPCSQRSQYRGCSVQVEARCCDEIWAPLASKRHWLPSNPTTPRSTGTAAPASLGDNEDVWSNCSLDDLACSHARGSLETFVWLDQTALLRTARC